MTTRFFLLLERLQKIDARLGMARSRQIVDALEVVRLHDRRRMVRQRLTRSMLRSPALLV